MAETGRRRSERLKSRISDNPPIEQPVKKQRLSSKGKAKWKVQSQPVSTNANDSQSNKNESQPQLTDECLLKVFEHLDLKSLCATADVSKHFRQLSKEVFSDHFDELDFAAINRLLLRRVLRKFGGHVSSIAFTQTSLGPIDVNTIAKYCTKLERLSLTMIQIDCDDFTPVFARLKYLSLDRCDMNGDRNRMFAACTELEQLVIDAKKYHDIPKCLFPSLTMLRFECDTSWKWSYLWQLLQLNQQIIRLYLVALPDDLVISNIVQHAKQLEELYIEPGLLSQPPKKQSWNGLIELGQLTSLKQLSLHTGNGNYGMYAGSLANKLSTMQVNLEFLCLESFQIDRNGLKNILRLKTLDKLVLVSMDEFNDNDLVKIAKKLPLLEEIRIDINFTDDAVISINGLVDMIQCAKKLTYLGLNGVRNMIIDQNIFEALVALVEQRGIDTLKIAIIGCDTTTGFNVPQRIQLKHRSVLQIDYQNDEVDSCPCEQCKKQFAVL